MDLARIIIDTDPGISDHIQGATGIGNAARAEPQTKPLPGHAVEVYSQASLGLGYAGCALHDPLTLAAVIAPELLTYKEY